MTTTYTRNEVELMLCVSITTLKAWAGKCDANPRYLPVHSYPVDGKQPVYAHDDLAAFLNRPENEKYLERYKSWLQQQAIQQELRALQRYRELKPVLEQFLGLQLVHTPPGYEQASRTLRASQH